MMTATPEAIITIDPHGVITAWNPAAERLFGYPAADAIGRPFTLMTPDADLVDGQDPLLQLVTGEAEFRTGAKRQHQNGSLIDVEMTISAIRDPAGTPLGNAIVAHEAPKVTIDRAAARRKAPARPGDTRSLSYIALARTPGAEPEIVYLSPQFTEVTGHVLRGTSGHSGIDGLVHPDDREHRAALRRQAEQAGEPLEAEYRLLTSDNQTIWVREWATMVESDQGGPGCWLGYVDDISQERHLEAAIAASDLRFQTVFENAPIGMALVGPDLRFFRANRALCDMLGYSEPELVTRTVADITHPDDLATTAEATRRLVAGEIPATQLEKRYVRRNGEVLWGLISSSAVRDETGAIGYFIAQIADITARKAVEAERITTNQHLREVVERITDGFFTLDRNWRFSYLNEAAEEILGRTRADLTGANIWAEFPLTVDTPFHTAALQAMADGMTTGYELYYPPFDSWFAGRIYPSPRGLSVFFHNVTGQRRAESELAATVAELQAINRDLALLSDAKSDFVSMISHDFRTPLTSIQGFSELLIEEDLSPEQMREFAATINQNALRLSRMIGDVLDLARIEAGQDILRFVASDLNALVEQVVCSLQPTSPDHRIITKLDPTLPTVWCDQDLIIRVITNLLANAVKYTPGGGDLVVSTQRAQDMVELTVRDPGLGVPEPYRESIFNRYGRIARPEQAGIEGTGLGLPIARQIVDMHHGRIWVEPNEPVGSAFHVLLPIRDPSLVM